MLNEIHLEGAVTRTWSFRDVQFARIACRVDPGRVRVSETDTRPSEYITLRFEPPTLARAASTLKPGQVVRASGYLASREYDITLKNFAESAEGSSEAVAKIQDLAKGAADQVRKPHVLNEIVVERFSVVDDGQPLTGRRPRRRGQQTQRPSAEATN